MSILRALRVWGHSSLIDLTYSPSVRHAGAAGMWLAGAALRRSGRVTSGVRLALKAHRFALPAQSRADVPTVVQRHVETFVRRAIDRGDFQGLRADVFGGSEHIRDWLQKQGIVLKTPEYVGDRYERGVLLLKYTKAFTEFVRAVDIAALLRDYYLVLEPSWAGYLLEDILQFCQYQHGVVVVMATEGRDAEALRRLGSNLVPAEFGASDWVHPELFKPIPGVQKEFDAIMISFWGTTKRHHALFRALRAMSQPDFKMALVGFPFGYERADIEALAELYAVRDQLTFFERLSPAEVNLKLNQSRVNLLLSLKEGSNKGIFEGFFADVPGMILHRAVGPAKSYFTPQTGKLVDEATLPTTLRWFREHAHEFRPREWALDHISPQVTTAKLERILAAAAEQRGEPWTRGLVVKCNAPDLSYLDPRDAATLPTFSEVVAAYPPSGAGAQAASEQAV